MVCGTRDPPPSWKKNIFNFHFDYLHPSLIITLFSENSTTFSTGFNHCNFSFPSRSRLFPRMEASDSLPEFREWIFSFVSRSQISGMEFFHSLPVPELREWIFLFPSRSRIYREWVFSIPFPFPNFGNGIIHSSSRSRTPKCHSSLPLNYSAHFVCFNLVLNSWMGWLGTKCCSVIAYGGSSGSVSQLPGTRWLSILRCKSTSISSSSVKVR